MNFSPSEVVAPRPVRLTSAPYSFLSRAQPVRVISEPAIANDATERPHSVGDLKLGFYPESSPDVSPRSSPRSALPSEALEEFLSILKPNIFPPRSPVRNRRQVSLPTLHHENPFSYKGRARLETTVEDVENIRSTHTSSVTPTEGIEGVTEFQLLDMEDTPFRWFAANVLSSPISRNHTRNPFQRHATYPLVSSPRIFTPLPQPALSPVAIPLPPSPSDELSNI